MVIQLISFPFCVRFTKRIRDFRIREICRIIEHSEADFIMFSPHALRSKMDLEHLNFCLSKQKAIALFEIKKSLGLSGNRLYLLRDRELISMNPIGQLFSSANEASKDMVSSLIGELESDGRTFVVGDKKFLVIQCGENNILKGSSGVAEFRFGQYAELKKRFESVLRNVDVILNPVHTYWRRNGHFKSRIRKFSDKKRYCFSCTQMVDNQLTKARKSPTQNTTHIAMYNKKLISPVYTNSEEDYLVQTYNID